MSVGVHTDRTLIASMVIPIKIRTRGHSFCEDTDYPRGYGDMDVGHGKSVILRTISAAEVISGEES